MKFRAMESEQQGFIDEKTVQQLSKGILELYEPSLVTISTHLKELTEGQEAVNAVVTSESRRLQNLQSDADIDALMANIATEKEKLTSITNSMKDILKRVQALMVRAANVERVAKMKAETMNEPTT